MILLIVVKAYKGPATLLTVDSNHCATDSPIKAPQIFNSIFLSPRLVSFLRLLETRRINLFHRLSAWG